MSKDHGGWKFCVYILLVVGFVLLATSAIGCTSTMGKTATAAPAPVAEDVARSDPFYRDSFDGLVACSQDDIDCNGGMTPDEVVAVLKRPPEHTQAYEHAQAGISGVVFTYIDSFGYSTVFLFRRPGPASSKAVPHLFYMSTNMPTVLERPRVR